MEQQRWRALWRLEHEANLSPQAYLELASAKSRTRNGVSGVKLHYYQLGALQKAAGAIEAYRGLSPTQTIAKVFPRAKYIWLRRHDKIGQAISLQLAFDTDQWWSVPGAESPSRPLHRREPTFDPHALARWELVLKRHEAKWSDYFHANGIEPLTLHYEDLAADYPGAIRQAIGWLGVADAASLVIPPPRLQRQSNALSDDWRSRFREFRKHADDAPSEIEAKDAVDPLVRRGEAPLTISDLWKQWTARSRLRHVSDEAIVGILVDNGHTRAAALAEVARSAADPYLAVGEKLQHQITEATHLAEAQSRMARLDPSAAAIQRRAKLSREDFRDSFYAANRPVVIDGLMGEWKAMTAWTPDYLKRVVGDVRVEVMAPSVGNAAGVPTTPVGTAEMGFAAFIEGVFDAAAPGVRMVASNQFLRTPATAPLFGDLVVFPDYLDPGGASAEANLWLGPPGVMAPLFRRPRNILLAQVVGRQRHRLIPASEWPHPRERDAGLAAGGVGLGSRTPGARPARVLEVILGPGEVLFAPVGWRHEMTALDVSLTVSFSNFIFPNKFDWSASSHADLASHRYL